MKTTSGSLSSGHFRSNCFCDYQPIRLITLLLITLLLITLLLVTLPRWAAAEETESEFESIFDGKSLAGWHAVPKDSSDEWSVEDGKIVGEGSKNRLVYLVWKDDQLEDFELKFSYRLPGKGNTGVEIRSRKDQTSKRPFEGYHADLGHVGIGANILGAWDFHFAQRKEYPCPRGTRLVINADGSTLAEDLDDPIKLKEIKSEDWNQVHIIARGRRFQFYINQKLSSAFEDNMPQYLERGAIAFQIHDRGMIVEFKDVQLKRLSKE